MPGGRPTKLTPETTQKILAALRGGNYRNVACEYAGISYQTFRTWMIRGENDQDDPMYHEFRSAVEEAEAQAEVADIATIGKAARDGDWRAAAWRRERKSPDRWALRQRTEVQLTGADGGPIDVRTSMGADAETIASLAAILSRRSEESHDPLKRIAARTEAAEASRGAEDGSGPPERPTGPEDGPEDLERFRLAPGELSETTMPKLYDVAPFASDDDGE